VSVLNVLDCFRVSPA